MLDDSPNPRVAERLARAARAAQALSETLWEALHEELADPSPQRVVELTERLVEVPATVLSLARAAGAGPPAAQGPQDPQATPERSPERSLSSEPSQANVAPGSPTARTLYERPPTGEPLSTAVLIDELAQAPDEPAADEPTADAPDREQSSTTLAPAPPRIQIRDERGEEASSSSPGLGEEGPAAWIGAIGRRLERYERDGQTFAVLLVELADFERLRHAELPGEVSRLTGLVEAALANELRPADTLTRESPGRYWLLAPETDVDSAGPLAGRLASAVRRSASHRGAPLEVAVGVAVCPEHGHEAAALAAHADIGLYAARASGRPVA